MGRKDASQPKMNIDQYRKQIGKHQYKKTDKDVKSAKRQAEAKFSQMGVTDVILVLVTILGLIVGIYLFIYISISKNEVPNSS